MFSDRDIDTTPNGDLIVAHGDLAISTASNSLLRAVNFCLLTMHSDYKPERDFGASPDAFIGKPNDGRTRNYMRMHMSHELRQQGILTSTNYMLMVEPIGAHEIAVVIRIDEDILETLDDTEITEHIIAYKYDFNNGTLEKVE
jgi:hypothetical protein